MLLLPAAVCGVVVWRAQRERRTSFGLGLRDGAPGEFGRGAVFSVPFLVGVLLLALMAVAATRFARGARGSWRVGGRGRSRPSPSSRATDVD